MKKEESHKKLLERSVDLPQYVGRVADGKQREKDDHGQGKRLCQDSSQEAAAYDERKKFFVQLIFCAQVKVLHRVEIFVKTVWPSVVDAGHDTQQSPA